MFGPLTLAAVFAIARALDVNLFLIIGRGRGH